MQTIWLNATLLYTANLCQLSPQLSGLMILLPALWWCVQRGGMSGEKRKKTQKKTKLQLWPVTLNSDWHITSLQEINTLSSKLREETMNFKYTKWSSQEDCTLNNQGTILLLIGIIGINKSSWKCIYAVRIKNDFRKFGLDLASWIGIHVKSIERLKKRA